MTQESPRNNSAEVVEALSDGINCLVALAASPGSDTLEAFANALEQLSEKSVAENREVTLEAQRLIREIGRLNAAGAPASSVQALARGCLAMIGPDLRQIAASILSGLNSLAALTRVSSVESLVELQAALGNLKGNLPGITVSAASLNLLQQLEECLVAEGKDSPRVRSLAGECLAALGLPASFRV